VCDGRQSHLRQTLESLTNKAKSPTI